MAEILPPALAGGREFAAFMILSEAMQRASESFYVYFGPIPLARLSAIERVAPRSAS
jgi:hypothetical protein